MIQFTTNAEAIARLAKVLEGNAKQLQKDVRTAVNKTVTNVQSQWAKEIQVELKVPQKVIKQTLRKEIAQSIEDPSGSVVLSKSKRLPLKEFKPRQTKKGVTYTAYKSKPRNLIPGAFMGPKPGAVAIKLGGHVWSRVGDKREMTKGSHKGRMRQPIVKRFGPTPYDATVTFEIPKRLLTVARKRLLKELQNRISFREKKASGVI